MTPIRGGEERDLAAVVAMGQVRAAPFRFHLDRDVDFVQYAITKRRLLAGLGPAGERQLHFFIAEEGNTAAAYYTDDHVTLTGALFVSGALALGAVLALVNAIAAPRPRRLIAAVVPAAFCYVVVGIVGWYVSSFIVKPNELVREQPYIAHNIELTRQAYGLDRITQHPFPADTGLDALDLANNQLTLQISGCGTLRLLFILLHQRSLSCSRLPDLRQYRHEHPVARAPDRW